MTALSTLQVILVQCLKAELTFQLMLQADEARRQAEMAEQQSAEQRFLELQQKAQEEQEK